MLAAFTLAWAYLMIRRYQLAALEWQHRGARAPRPPERAHAAPPRRGAARRRAGSEA